MNLCGNLNIISYFTRNSKTEEKKNLIKTLPEKNCLIFWMNLLNKHNNSPEIFLKIFFLSKKNKINENLYIIDKIIEFEDFLYILNKISFKKMLILIQKIFKNTSFKREIELFFSYIKLKGFVLEETFFEKENELLIKNYHYSFYKIYYHLKENIHYLKKLLCFIENDIIGFCKKLKNSKIIFFKEFSDHIFKIIIFLICDIDLIKEISLIKLISEEIEKFLIIQSNFLLLEVNKKINKKGEGENFNIKNGKTIFEFFNQYILFIKKNEEIEKLNVLKLISKFLIELNFIKIKMCKNTQLSIHDFLQRIKKIEKIIIEKKCELQINQKTTPERKKRNSLTLIKSFKKKRSLQSNKSNTYISSLFKLVVKTKTRNLSPKIIKTPKILKKSAYYQETSKSNFYKTSTKTKKSSLFRQITFAGNNKE